MSKAAQDTGPGDIFREQMGSSNWPCYLASEYSPRAGGEENGFVGLLLAFLSLTYSDLLPRNKILCWGETGQKTNLWFLLSSSKAASTLSQ